MPRLLKDFARLTVFVIALGAIISEVFEKSIAGFLAASVGSRVGPRLCPPRHDCRML